MSEATPRQLRAQICQLEKRLKATELLGERLFESSPNCVKVLDLEGRVVRMNENGIKAMEIDDFELYRQTEWLSFWKAEYQSAARRALSSAKKGQLGKFRGSASTTKGNSRWWDVMVSPIFDEQQQVAQLLCVSQDVSERIQSEQTAKTAKRQLESALFAGEIGTWYYDITRNRATTDPQLAVWFGIEPEDAAIGLPIDTFLAAIHPQDRERVTKAIERSIVEREEYRCEYRVRDANGKERYVLAQGHTEYDEQGEPVSFLGAIINITKRRRAEKALRASERRTRKILNSLFSFVGVVSLEGILLEANHTALGFADLAPEDVIGKPFEEAYWWSYSSDSQVRLRTAIQQARQGETVRYDADVRVKDGQFMTVDFTLVPVLDRAGEVEYLIPSGIDITERKRAEDALKNSESLLRLALANARAGSWSWTIPTEEIVWSVENYRLYGLNPDQGRPQYKDWDRALHPDDRERVNAEIANVVEQRAPEFRSEFRIVRPEGGIRWLLGIGSLTLDENGNSLQLSGINLDITERKQSERQTLKDRETITQQLSEIEAIYDNAPIGLTLLDQKLRFVRVNQKLSEINGLPIEAHLGRTIREVLPKLANTAEPLLQEILETGEPKLNVEITGETPAQPGVERVWLESWYPLKSATGKVAGINIVVQEITERKQAEQEREQLLVQAQSAKEEAEAANRMKDEFLAVVSHELRTPLNPILGWSQLLARGPLSENKMTHALKTITRNAKMQAQLIDDLLDVSSILRGKLALQSEPVQLEAIVRAAIETVQLSAQAKSIEICTHFDPSVKPVRGDAGRLQQIVWNILSNAIKFTPDGGRIDVLIQHSENADDNRARIVVRDTGKGISADFLPYLFDRFRQQDSATTRRFGGLGLGLAISRHLVELHGGVLSADSAGEGQGATFAVELPLMRSEVSLESSTQTAVSTIRDIKVLVVDDQEDARDIAAALLEDVGASVVLTSSAQEALTAMRHDSFDVIISDIGMPKTDGYQLIQEIRALSPEQGGQIPAICLTAYAGEIDLKKAKEAGFHRHIAKPIEQDVLLAAIANVI